CGVTRRAGRIIGFNRRLYCRCFLSSSGLVARLAAGGQREEENGRDDGRVHVLHSIDDADPQKIQTSSQLTSGERRQGQTARLSLTFRFQYGASLKEGHEGTGQFVEVVREQMRQRSFCGVVNHFVETK